MILAFFKKELSAVKNEAEEPRQVQLWFVVVRCGDSEIQKAQLKENLNSGV